MPLKNEALTLESLVLEITTHNIHEEQLKDRPTPPPQTPSSRGALISATWGPRIK